MAKRKNAVKQHERKHMDRAYKKYVQSLSFPHWCAFVSVRIREGKEKQALKAKQGAAFFAKQKALNIENQNKMLKEIVV